MALMSTSDFPRPVRRRVFTALTVLWALLSLGILASMVSPVMLNTAMTAAAALGYALNPLLVIFVVVGILLLVVALRRRRRVLVIIAGVTTALLAVGVVVPTALLVNFAAERDIAVSATALFEAPSGGLDEPTETVSYLEVDGQELQMDVWQAENQGDAANSALIYVFGGAYQSGTRADWTPYFQHLTSQGISVFAMDYRLSTPGQPSWTAAASDVACAVGWVRDSAETYNIDTDRLVLSGGSAGANLALLTAYSAGTGSITPSCDAPDTSVRAVIDFYGPVNLAETATDTGSPAVTDALEQYLGATLDENPERYAAMSPSSYITGNVPPTLILHGTRDTGVPKQQSIDLAASLDEVGVPNTLVLVPAAEHGFDAIFGSFGNQIAQAEVTRFFDRYVTN